jgi:hypothetical protein
MNEDLADELEFVPCEDRPHNILTFPRGLPYSRRWTTLRLYLLMLAPILLSAGLASLQNLMLALIVVLTGAGTAAGLLVTVSSGVASTNTGTYLQSREPVRYWLNVLILVAAYVFLSSVGYLSCCQCPGSVAPAAAEFHSNR